MNALLLIAIYGLVWAHSTYHWKIFHKNIDDFVNGTFSTSHFDAINGKTEHFPLMVLIAETINGQQSRNKTSFT